MSRDAIAPALKFLAAHLVLFGLIAWVDQLYSNLLLGVGGRLENLPYATQGPLVLARWLVEGWPVLVIFALVVSAIYGIAVTPPEGKRPKLWLVALLWIPLVFFYGIVLWLAVAQRRPIQTMQRVTGVGASITEHEPAVQTPATPPTNEPPVTEGPSESVPESD